MRPDGAVPEIAAPGQKHANLNHFEDIEEPLRTVDRGAQKPQRRTPAQVAEGLGMAPHPDVDRRSRPSSRAAARNRATLIGFCSLAPAAALWQR